MPRSATDATRFTSTTPYASAKPPPSAQKSKGPVGETPQEKIRRLRAAADRARDAQVTTFDKIVIRGRVWADRAHRFTALSLIGATFVAGGVTVYTFWDMIVYNRKKRAQFYQEQKAKQQSAVHDAREAIAAGTATEAQINFIKMEDDYQSKVDAAKKKKAEPGPVRKARDWLFEGLKKEEQGKDVGTSERRLGYEALSEEDDSMGERESDIVRALEDKKIAITEKAKHAFAQERHLERTGGPLDRIGTATETSVVVASATQDQPKSKSWSSWIMGR
ncbi:uncharacterized protein LY89DRAFT_578692 [Mollisia scopiformis]|uniref:Uncharacterized protein n=1 Tax=Mollisia scopiformis TaxID=149040 RepID=A0A194XKP1_MOLSC|nr:uncharacterized protein LY89DRAFT_578692 [Mollisia scopiformis]KUJ20357.1 hypothetical protein LY89DRAFT_578692 [Mollisia scopiformis]